MLVVCERWAGVRDRLLYWPINTSFSSWLGCSTVGHWGPKAPCLPLALNSASCLQLTVFQITQILSPLLPGMMSFTLQSHFLYIYIYIYIYIYWYMQVLYLFYVHHKHLHFWTDSLKYINTNTGMSKTGIDTTDALYYMHTLTWMHQHVDTHCFDTNICILF